ncbi:beta-amyrin 28-monooxygenase-like [Salvia hispanica]|uniref:beta-amyrin 28-monooxygenase-like n=1 Tax=Salvia hispanica TaxID=49212 RepID=UPI0020090481|nr:beta-amyrin 28-monooxygenase-like [Salvia hispanica]
MELFTLVVSILLIAITFFLLRRRSSGNARLPPGSFGWPIIGESVEFLFGNSEKFVGDRMLKYSPEMFKTKILGEKTAVICGPAGNKFLFSNEEKLFSMFRPHSMQHLFRSNKPKPALNMPEVVRQPGFLKPEALMRYLAGMDLITQKQLHIHCDGKKIVEFYPLSKTITLTIACQFFLGINNPDRIARLVETFDDVTRGMASIMLNLPGTTFYRANKAAAALRKELIAVVEEKKEAMAEGAGPMHDILSHMIAASDPSGSCLPESEIADKMMGLLISGYGNVSTTITFVMKHLGLNPDIYERVRAEQLAIAVAKKEGVPLHWEDMAKMKYSWNVICETMRMVPFQGTFREVIEEFTYAGYTIPKGWKVYWTVSTTCMSPQYFKDPKRFNPSRYDEGEAPPPYTYMPFGKGLRMCPGNEYARIVMLTFVHNVVKNYRWEMVDPNEKVSGSMIPEPQKGLPVRLYHH